MTEAQAPRAHVPRHGDAQREAREMQRLVDPALHNEEPACSREDPGRARVQQGRPGTVNRVTIKRK